MSEVILTWKELTILEFIKRFHKTKGYAPTIREIGKGCGYGSTSLIKYYVDKLARAKKLRRDPEIARGIVIIEEE
jgi:repressor LexA